MPLADCMLISILSYCIETPADFEFPFTPYSIQHEFMKCLYETISNKKLGVFESPTGTGKSLSIICGALRWLKDHNENEHKKLIEKIKELENEKLSLASSSANWLNCQSKEIEITFKLNQLKLEKNRIDDYDKKIEKLHVQKKSKTKKNWVNDPMRNKNDPKLVTSETSDLENDADGILDDEGMLLDEVIPVCNEESSSDDEDAAKYEPVKILICSRTHSQLSQFVREIIKSPFGKDTRTVSLASRQTYCINPAVTKLKNVSLINERCLDMQKKPSKATKINGNAKVVKRSKESPTCQCLYYKQQNIEELRDASLIDIQDVEDLVQQAKQLKACPYYASRQAATDAQIVLVPYNTLLHKSTREANGIKIKNNVIIIDEAHNILEALAQMYSAEVNYVQLTEAKKHLFAYKQRYSTRFSAFNLLCINQLLFIISRLIEILSNETDIKSDDIKTRIYTVENFVVTSGIDNYNIFKLIQFCRDSKISHKIHNFSNKYTTEIKNCDATKKSKVSGVREFLSNIKEGKCSSITTTQEIVNKEEKVQHNVSLGNPFLIVLSFMEALTYSYEDGRIIVHESRDTKQRKLQFLLLNPAAQFKEIVKQARSVIVAGGTMKPMSEFKERLFISAGASLDQIVEFSCDHVIPPQNILPLVITKGLNQENLLFNFENRLNMGLALKQILQDVCLRVKGGIVVFFPSYNYEDWVWQQLKNVDFSRPVFREPQNSALVQSVLDSYGLAIHKANSNGAMLFSVVGGKLSEGLNFSDDLGRCVIVVGLPYANINSPELKEKMAYLDKTECKGAGQKFYESLCMKSVNQCIGRAVRHQNDYACILLLDLRYDRAQVKSALPGWIKRSLNTCDYKQACSLMKKFYTERTCDGK